MAPKEVIEACVQKAIDNGWGNFSGCRVSKRRDRFTITLFWGENGSDYVSWDWVMFHDEFAKALWGENIDKPYYSRWKHHLQALAISEDRIEYLKNHAL